MHWQDIQLPLSYHFEPNHPRDGVTVTIPAPLLAQVPETLLQWLVPGVLTARCIALVRQLPKATRKSFVPVPDYVGAALEGMPFAEGSLTEALGQQLLRMTGVRVSEELWQQACEQLEEHLQMNIEVVDAAGKKLGEGRDLAELRSRFSGASQQALAELKQVTSAPQAVVSDTFTVEAQSTHKVAGMAMTVYPALVDSAGEVQEGRFSTQQQADQEHRRALQRLLLQQVAEPAKYLRSRLPGLTDMALLYRDLGRVEALTEDILLASVDRCMLQGLKVLPRDAQAVAQLAESKRGEFVPAAEHLAKTVLLILQRWHEIKKRLKGRIDLSMAVALNDIKTQLTSLLYVGFIRDTPAQWLQEYPRYLKAIEQRLDKLPSQVQQDRVWTVELSAYQDKLKKRQNKHSQEGKYDEALTVYRWMLEEYRVSLFAQQLGTKIPVSDKRLSKQWSAVGD